MVDILVQYRHHMIVDYIDELICVPVCLQVRCECNITAVLI